MEDLYMGVGSILEAVRRLPEVEGNFELRTSIDEVLDALIATRLTASFTLEKEAERLISDGEMHGDQEDIDNGKALKRLAGLL
jgi:hypothetical protein